MPDSNPGTLPQKSGALPMSHHIYIEPYAVSVFWALGIVLAHAYTETVDQARRPSIPQLGSI